jgi:hypothetical protein
LHELSSKEKELYNDKEVWEIRNSSGTRTRRIDYENSSICFITHENKKLLLKTLNVLKNASGDAWSYKPDIKLKPETEKHFGDIVNNLMEYNLIANKIIEEMEEETAQDLMSGHMAGQRQLTHNMLQDPKKLLQLMYRSPGMHADLLAGRMDLLSQKFKQYFGVDFAQIANQVAAARELLNKEKQGKKVPVKRAIPV